MAGRKEIKQQYKQTLQPMGVYQIRNNINGKIFIGSSLNIPGKINSCQFQLKNGIHTNSPLQQDYFLLGGQNFSFDVLDYLLPQDTPGYDYRDDLKAFEEMWIEKLEPFAEKGYNTEKKKVK